MQSGAGRCCAAARQQVAKSLLPSALPAGMHAHRWQSLPQMTGIHPSIPPPAGLSPLSVPPCPAQARRHASKQGRTRGAGGLDLLDSHLIHPVHQALRSRGNH